MLSFGKYVRVGSAEEAYELVQRNRRACVLGGGAWLRLGSGAIPLAIDLSDCGLDAVREIPDDPAFGRALGLGAYVTLRQLETDARVAAVTGGLLARAVRDIVGVQFRNVATVGGSVAGRFGFSDVCCALVALGAHAELVGAGRMPVEALLSQPGRLRDVLTRVIIPAGPVRAGYQAVRNQSTDFPVVSACAVRAQDGSWRVAVGARPGRARLIAGTAGAASVAAQGHGGEKNPATGGAAPSDSGVPAASLPLAALSAEPAPAELDALEAAARVLPFSGNMWASARYRRQVAGTLARRAVEEAAGQRGAAASADAPAGAAAPQETTAERGEAR